MSIIKLALPLLTAFAAISSNALADSGPPMPPTISLMDENHVDMLSGMTTFPITLFSIGEGPLGVSFSVEYKDVGDYGSMNSHNSLQGFSQQHRNILSVYYYYVGLSGESIDTYNGNVNSTNGASVANNGNGAQTFTNRDGTVMQLVNGYATSVTYANGKTLRYNGSVGGDYPSAWSVLQNNGILVKRDSNGNYVAVNLAYEYCDPNPSVICSLTKAWPTAHETQGPSSLTVVDASGGTYQFTLVTNGTAIGSYHDKSWAPGVTISYKRCARTGVSDCFYLESSTNTYYPLLDRVETATKNGVTWQFGYDWNAGPNGYIYKLISPFSRTMRGSSQGLGYPTGYSDEFRTAINFDGTVNARLSQLSHPEGNVDVYTYDPRGNYTDLKKYMKGNAGIPTSSAHVDYDVACSSTVKCNQPNYYVDLNGNRTDYTYDLSTGLKLTETLPAVNVCTISGCNFVRPVNRFAYVQRSAWYLNSSGGYTRDLSPIWLLSTEKTCQTSATVSGACTTTGDEIVKTYDYGPDSGPNNLWLRGVAITAAGITRRSCYSYDRLGKKVSETTPAASLTACP